MKQDSLLQSVLFGQVPETSKAEPSRIVLRRLAAAGKPAAEVKR